MSTTLSISTASVTKLLVIEQLLQPALKFAVSVHDQIYSIAPSRNKSWQRHCPAKFRKESEIKIRIRTLDPDLICLGGGVRSPSGLVAI